MIRLIVVIGATALIVIYLLALIAIGIASAYEEDK